MARALGTLGIPPGLLRESLPAYARFLGVTGAAASGKSTCRAWLAKQPGPIVCVDADALAHAAYVPGGPAYASVSSLFPAAVQPDGSLDRRVIGARVFADPAALRALNEAVWPAVGALALAEFQRAAEGATAPITGVLEAALLLEAGWGGHFDAVWLLGCSEEAALARLQQRGLDAAGAAARLAVQPRVGEREASARAALPGLPLRVFDTTGAPEAAQAAYATALAELRGQ